MMPLERSFPGPAFAVQEPSGKITTLRPVAPEDLATSAVSARRLKVYNLKDSFPGRNVETPLLDTISEFQDADSWVSQCFFTSQTQTSFQMMRAGPRRTLRLPFWTR